MSTVYCAFSASGFDAVNSSVRPSIHAADPSTAGEIEMVPGEATIAPFAIPTATGRVIGSLNVTRKLAPVKWKLPARSSAGSSTRSPAVASAAPYSRGRAGLGSRQSSSAGGKTERLVRGRDVVRERRRRPFVRRHFRRVRDAGASDGHRRREEENRAVSGPKAGVALHAEPNARAARSYSSPRGDFGSWTRMTHAPYPGMFGAPASDGDSRE